MPSGRRPPKAASPVPVSGAVLATTSAPPHARSASAGSCSCVATNTSAPASSASFSARRDRDTTATRAPMAVANRSAIVPTPPVPSTATFDPAAVRRGGAR